MAENPAQALRCRRAFGQDREALVGAAVAIADKRERHVELRYWMARKSKIAERLIVHDDKPREVQHAEFAERQERVAWIRHPRRAGAIHRRKQRLERRHALRDHRRRDHEMGLGSERSAPGVARSPAPTHDSGGSAFDPPSCSVSDGRSREGYFNPRACQPASAGRPRPDRRKLNPFCGRSASTCHQKRALRRRLGQRGHDAVDHLLDNSWLSPSAITRITGSVPEGRMTSRPCPSSRCSAASIADLHLGVLERLAGRDSARSSSPAAADRSGGTPRTPAGRASSPRRAPAARRRSRRRWSRSPT